MPRNRVLSFMSQWGQQSPDSSPSSSTPPTKPPFEQRDSSGRRRPYVDTSTAQTSARDVDGFAQGSPVPASPSTPSRARGDSRPARPSSMIQTYQPPQVDVASDTPPELQPIFSFLNSHSNKLYQEGYFLKLHDLDTRGRPSTDRTWMECFAQLVGTVLSLWDAAALDVAGADGEVVPTFINLSDASLKMIESLPMSGVQGGKLQNVLSISTAANNRYLLHFNSLNSLTQWTAGIRLAMFEHSALQEAYTGSLIAGKGKLLNNIKAIMDRSKFAHEDWTRVRFGAGTPWRRCWCVVSQPDEKDYQKAQKMQKKGSSYSRATLPKGEIKFYDTRKVTKKTNPIATVTDAYAAYAIYPQSKPLIDQSTLVKLEGLVTIHRAPATTTEGFVFVMPEVHPAVTGFEMMLQWLFPVWDTFNMYGRPSRLVADTLDQRGLMFAMPRDRRYGYLDTLDVSGLIHTTGSQAWSERQWRREMKKLTSDRMSTQSDGRGEIGEMRQTHRRNTAGSRSSLPSASRGGGVRFDDDDYSSSPSRTASPVQAPGAADRFALPKRVDTAPASQYTSPHKRAASDAPGYRRFQAETPSALAYEANPAYDDPPEPPRHAGVIGAAYGHSPGPGSLQRIESGVETPTLSTLGAGFSPPSPSQMPPPQPVATPPAFTHSPSSRPANQPAVAPELRRAHSSVDAATLLQMQEAASQEHRPEEDYGNEVGHRVDTTAATQRNLGVPYADRSQGPPDAISVLKKRDPRQRLSTIPGSPYVNNDNGTFQQSDSQTIQQPDGTSKVDGPYMETLSENGFVRSTHSISRKPLPKPPQDLTRSEEFDSQRPYTEHTSSPDASEYGSLRTTLIDQDALERILQQDARVNSMGSIASSTADYASIVDVPGKADKQPPTERPRMGKLKTVGDPGVAPGDSRTGKFDTWKADREVEAAVIPPVDFGPTLTYKPTGRPSTSGNATPGDRSRSRSTDRLRGSSADRLSGYMGQGQRRPSPAESNRYSYFNAYYSGATTPNEPALIPSGTSEHLHQPGNRHSIAWTPGASPGPSQRQSLTPEQWVQHRAAMASQPQQPIHAPNAGSSHTRQPSLPNASQWRRSLSKTPPPFGRRTPSGDWSQQERRTPPSRPSSRGAGAYLNQPTTLSAKEQMHVAKATGTPLVGMSSRQRQEQDEGSPGLVGTLAAREREKAAFKEGMRSGQVEQAIRARQQQQAQMKMEIQMQQGLQAQQGHQQAAITYRHEQNAYENSMLGNSQATAQYWGQPDQQYNPYMQHPSQVYGQAQPGYASPTQGGENGPGGGFNSAFAQRLYEGQQQQAFMAQQGQQQMRRPGDR